MTISNNDVYKQKIEIEKLLFEPIEAVKRLVISRGYYATFLYARLIVKNEEFNIPLITKDPKGYNLGSHASIYESMIAQKDFINLSDIGLKLKNYHGLRKISDYELSYSLTKYDETLAEKYFSECKEQMDFFLKNPDLPFTKKKRVIEATKSLSGEIQTSTLRILK